MTKRISHITQNLLPQDGASQQRRRLQSLDPSYVSVDERSPEDLLAFVRALAGELHFYQASSDGPVPSGTWSEFANFLNQELSPADVALYSQEPERFTGNVGQWLGRPHFALLLVFLELMRHARQDFDALTGRHLDYYYKEVLRLAPLTGSPDRVFVDLTLLQGASEVRLPVGTALDAGRSGNDRPRHYLTERELTVSQARVADVRAIHVDQQVLTIHSARKQPFLTDKQKLDASLRVALHNPPDGPLLPWVAPNGVRHLVGTAPEAGAEVFLHYSDWLKQTVLPLLEYSGHALHLELHELNQLLTLERRRAQGQGEWAKIKAELTIPNTAGDVLYTAQDFLSSFNARLVEAGGQPLDFESDALPLVNSIDDLLHHQDDPDVASYIQTRILQVLSIEQERLELALQLKLRIDSEWGAINRLLERAGRRFRKLPNWDLDTSAPEDFEGNWARAVPEIPWQGSIVAQLGVGDDIWGYQGALGSLEKHLHLTPYQLWQLATAAPSDLQQPVDWSTIDELLTVAHREAIFALRRQTLNLLAKQDELGEQPANSLPDDHPTVAQQQAAYPTLIAHVLTDPVTGKAPTVPADWSQQRALLALVLAEHHLHTLESHLSRLQFPWEPLRVGWDDILRVFELAERTFKNRPEPRALHTTWRNLYAYHDVRQLPSTGAAGRWPAFGRRPSSEDPEPPLQDLGWMVCSPLLAVASGRRVIQIAFELGHDLPSLASILDLPSTAVLEAGGAVLANALNIQMSTADGWVDLHSTQHAAVSLQLNAANQGSSADQASSPDISSLSLHMRVELDPAAAALVAPAELPAPALRLLLAQQSSTDASGDFMDYESLSQLQVSKVDLVVEVGLRATTTGALEVAQGLTDLRLQADDRPLDTKKAFEPFGSSPKAGAQLHIGHAELQLARLDQLAIALEWSELPVDESTGDRTSLASHYANYFDQPTDKNKSKTADTAYAAAVTALASPKGTLRLINGVRATPLLSHTKLFADATSQGETPAQHSLEVHSFPPQAQVDYQRLQSADNPRDLRASQRYLSLELHGDMGQNLFPAVSARRALALAKALAAGEEPPPQTRVPAPYIPTLARLEIGYRTSATLEFASNAGLAAAGPGALLHVHPFGWSQPTPSPVDASKFHLVPRYDHGGELYIGLSQLKTPRNVSLLFHAAEGTANTEALGSALEQDPLQWSYLDGNEWKDLRARGAVLHDSSRDLVQTGIVELALPECTSGTRLPDDLYWLRVATRYLPDRACDLVEIRPNAVEARFDDQDGPPEVGEHPLPAKTIIDLVAPDRRIERVEQIVPTFGGRQPETEQTFRTRVSERLRHKARALTCWDYEHLVLQEFPSLYKVKCIPAAINGKPCAVTVLVVPDTRDFDSAEALRPLVAAPTLAAIHSFLRAHAPAEAEIDVRSPSYVPIRIRLTVGFKAGVDPSFAKEQLNRDLIQMLSPWAYDKGGELTIGGQVYETGVVGFADSLDYVDFVANVQLFRVVDGQPQRVSGAVTTTAPDQVLVSARSHDIDLTNSQTYSQSSNFGIGHMKLELDFIVA